MGDTLLQICGNSLCKIPFFQLETFLAFWIAPDREELISGRDENEEEETGSSDRSDDIEL